MNVANVCAVSRIFDLYTAFELGIFNKQASLSLTISRLSHYYAGIIYIIFLVNMKKGFVTSKVYSGDTEKNIFGSELLKHYSFIAIS